MVQYKLLNQHSGQDLEHNNEVIADFLFEHLDQYGDKKEDIMKALDYVFDKNRGGHVILALKDNEIVGATVINHTGMSGYIPENILVYIAVHGSMRGEGLGKELMNHAKKITTGGIALHVEPDNPARHLYEKVGFTSKYLEMRFQK